jgi:hypothetical protein
MAMHLCDARQHCWHVCRTSGRAQLCCHGRRSVQQPTLGCACLQEGDEEGSTISTRMTSSFVRSLFKQGQQQQQQQEGKPTGKASAKGEMVFTYWPVP